ncbi:uncharacterized protein TM35_000013390 [Trypanosoma theileri]|uniref:Uncharacterized protein n=1 Tax=Trypanosoma theileri TaxID=67003 RepID=A0A1X0P959_9TRYP|nr:uncharacterized protein TM35_000013390 [Trypanosoma theileri]ORC93462.1 hypothetical protein TM35_000013390 [Trypanosoma theileri]
MNEEELRRIVKTGDAATLHAYIQRSQRPLSQPLDAEARFVYYHLPHDTSTPHHSLESRLAGGEPYEKSPNSLISDYHGPTTTVIIPPEGRKSDLGSRISRHQPSPSLGRQLYTQSNLSELAWVIDRSPWSSDILRSSSALFPPNEFRDVIRWERSSSERILRQSSGKKKLSSSYSLPSTSNIPMGRKIPCTKESHHHNKEKLKEILTGLQSVESEERRRRGKIEAAYSKLYIEAIRWHYMFLEQCDKDKTDLLKLEYTARCSIAEEENIHFKKILELSLDDVMGSCQDSVRMQWLRKLMANALTLHEWVNMNSSLTYQKGFNNRDAASKVGDVCSVGERNLHEDSGYREKRIPELKVTPEKVISRVDDIQTKTYETARDHRSMAVRPSRPRVLPLTEPHEECIVI